MIFDRSFDVRVETEQTVTHVHVRFATDKNVVVFAVQIGEQVESENYRAIGAVLEWYDTAVRSAILHRSKNIFNSSLWRKNVCSGRESVEGCL